MIDVTRSDKKYDAIVIAMGHKEFKNSLEVTTKLSVQMNLYFIDIKEIVEDPTWKL